MHYCCYYFFMIIIIIIIIIRWVHPDGGRKTYETKSPGSGEVLAATTQVVDLIYVNIQISNT